MTLVYEDLRFLVRGGLAADLAVVNEVPLDRELVIETDTRRSKLGDGTTPYNDLPYLPNGDASASRVITVGSGLTLSHADHAGAWLEVSGAVSIVLPETSGWTVGEKVEFAQAGVEQMTFATSGGASIAPVSDRLLPASGYRGAVLTARVIGMNTWRLSGDLAEKVLAITTQLKQWATGYDFQQQLQAAGGEAPYVWSVAAGTLPAGWSLSEGGLLLGSALPSAGVHPFTAQVDDSAATPSAQRAYNIRINADANFSDVISLLHGQGVGSAAPGDAKGLVWANVNGVTHSAAVTWFGLGTSLLFAGTNQYLSTPHTEALNIGAGDFTVEALLHPLAVATGASSAPKYAVQKVGAGYTSGYLLGVRWNPLVGRAVYFGQAGYNGSSESRIDGTIQAVAGASAHVALVKQGTTLTLYVNGVPDGSMTVQASMPANTGALVIGSDRNATTTGQRYWDGYVGAVRVTKGVARYIGAFAPPAHPFPK